MSKSIKATRKRIAEGERLFDWYNCSGCHFHGGGGMGPALMDQQWIYGGASIRSTPALSRAGQTACRPGRRKIPDAQIWEIAAYVKSLSAPNAADGTDQAMPTSPPAPQPKQ